MFNQLFGKYLVDTKHLTSEQLSEVVTMGSKIRVKLGLIAVSERLLTIQQADEINRLQAVMDKRFGDIAVEKGYLTEDQVSRLLGLQGNAYLTFAQILTDKCYMTLDEIEVALAEYQKKYGFTMTDMEALRSGDVDRIVPLFLPHIEEPLYTELIGVAIRTLIRLIDADTYLLKATFTDAFDADKIAMQDLNGEHKASLAFSAKGDNLLAIADTFAGESFDKVDADALDAVSEFINCINGLFATGISYSKIEMDMLPPAYYATPVKATARQICVIPLYIRGKRVELLVTFDEMMSV